MTSPSVPESLEAKTHPSRFHDEQIQQAVEALSLAYEDPQGVGSEPIKRRRISVDSTDMVINLVNEALDIQVDAGGVSVFTESMFL